MKDFEKYLMTEEQETWIPVSWSQGGWWGKTNVVGKTKTAFLVKDKKQDKVHQMPFKEYDFVKGHAKDYDDLLHLMSFYKIKKIEDL